MPTETFFAIECKAEGVSTEFFLNDIPLTRRGGAQEGTFYGAPVNHFIVPGANELAVVIGAGPTPGTSLGPEGRARGTLYATSVVEMRLGSYPKGAIVGGPDRTELGALSWTTAADVERHLPFVLTATAEVDSPFGPWEWQDAPEVELGPESVGDIVQLLEELRTGLDMRDFPHFIAANARRFPEVERAFYLPPGERAAGVPAMFGRVMSGPDFALADIDVDRLDFRLCAGNRMVQTVSTDGKAALRQVPDETGGGLLFDLFVSQLDGKWVIVR